MNDSPNRPARTTSLLAALGLAIAMLALAVAPSAQAVTGGAASAAPVPAESTATTPTTAFDEAELTFTPYRVAGASWYGGTSMWGRSTACGQTLRPSTIGVAN